MENIRELLVHELRDMLHAEQQLVKALPKMAEATTSAELRQAFEGHLLETEQHVNRLEQVFERLGETAKAKKCDGIAGIIKESEKLAHKDGTGSVMDAGLVCSAQKVEHYEIAAYGCLCTWAGLLGEEEAKSLLQQNLTEEKAADQKLTRIAETSINAKAQRSNANEEQRGVRSPAEPVAP